MKKCRFISADDGYIVGSLIISCYWNSPFTLARYHMQPRHDGRKVDELRPLKFQRRYTRQAPGSVLVRMGRTTVLCTCCVDLSVPPFLVGRGKGWLSAERNGGTDKSTQ